MSVKNIADLIQYLETRAPFATAEDWDNVGLLVGDPEAPLKKVVISDDLTATALKKARTVGANVIINHHPCIFRGLKSITASREHGLERLIFECIRDGVAVVSLHTNFDRADQSVADRVGRALGIVPDGRFGAIEGRGYGVWGRYPEETEVSDVVTRVKETFRIERILASAPLAPRVRTVGFTPGKGAAFISEAIQRKLDVFVTGEVGYHEMLRARNAGLTVLEVGHRESEVFFPEVVGEWLREQGIEVELDWVPTQTII